MPRRVYKVATGDGPPRRFTTLHRAARFAAPHGHPVRRHTPDGWVTVPVAEVVAALDTRDGRVNRWRVRRPTGKILYYDNPAVAAQAAIRWGVPREEYAMGRWVPLAPALVEGDAHPAQGVLTRLAAIAPGPGQYAPTQPRALLEQWATLVATARQRGATWPEIGAAVGKAPGNTQTWYGNVRHHLNRKNRKSTDDT